jgi:hypothetical protein
MSIRRATSAFMTKVVAFLNATPSNPNATNISMEAINPASQMNSSSGTLITSQSAIAAAINTGALTISGNGAGPMWLTIPSAALRAIIAGPGVDLSTLPSEPLQLSQECAANFGGGWDAVFAGLGFTTFAATASVPTINC